MKKILHFPLLWFLITLCTCMDTNGQTSAGYEAEWKAVEAALAKGLPATALAEVKKIYQAAKKDKQDAQVVKTVIYMVNLQDENREDAEQLSIDELQKEVAQSTGITKSVLQSLLASAYLNYYEAFRWNMLDQTALSRPAGEDVTTWHAADFHRRIAALYTASLQPSQLLQNTNLAKFEDIIQKGNTRHLRPTLYDLLAHKALTYFSSDEMRSITRPADAFEINTASAFDPAADFVHRKFEVRDSTSNEYLALHLYQQLMAFHLSDKNPDALLDVDLMRLQYVYFKSVHPQKGELYFNAVNHLAHQYEATPAAAQAWYLVASWYNDRGNSFVPGGDATHRLARVKAAEICEKIIRENPGTEGGINAHNLLEGIRTQTLQMTTENVAIPGKPFLALVTFRNLEKLSFRLISSTPELEEKMMYNRDGKFWTTLTALKSIRNWEQPLPDPRDHQEHRAEIKIDALPVGEYILLASTGETFTDRNKMLAARKIAVSDLGFIKYGDDFFVLHRESGQPVQKAEVKIWETDYDYSLQKTRKYNLRTYTPDKNGHFKRPWPIKVQRRLAELIEISTGNDRLVTNESIVTYYLEPSDKQEDPQRIFLFTDRSIYRPGQTVHYKGIVANQKTVVANSGALSVTLLNANGEQADSASHRTNAYGSFSGKFVIPKNGLNGTFTIVAGENGRINLKVEEYKRPRFEVAFDSLKTAYSAGDTIRVGGSGKAYAGNAVGGAKVVYRVVRTSRLVYPWLIKRWYMPMLSPVEITHGDMTTDAAGKFNIDFEAVPDRSVDKKLDPVFDYTIYADITDLNGETRSGTFTVSAGYKSTLLIALIPQTIHTDRLKSLKVSTKNLNGQFTPADVQVSITALVPENRLIRERYWQRPDVFIFSKETFVKDFPNDPYDAENEPENWAEGAIVFDQKFSTNARENINISGPDFKPGFYKIKLTMQDPAGGETSDVHYIELTDPTGKTERRPQYFQVENSEPIEPGESTAVGIGSAAGDAFVISYSGKQPGKFDYTNLGKTIQKFNFRADEHDRGGYWTGFALIKNNRLYTHEERIDVPWTNKDLQIKLLSFRDKTLPGSTEKWTVQLSGKQKDKIAAEMLAGMYDASLDQFYIQPWVKPAIWQMRQPADRWTGSRGFAFGDGMIRYPNRDDFKSFTKTYDELTGITRGLRRYRNRVYKKLMGGAVAPAPMSMAAEEIKEAVVADKTIISLRGQSADGIGMDTNALMEVVTVGYGTQKPKKPSPEETIQTRRNLDETAFFFPDLTTDADGNISFSFTLPEALTRWKFQALAHTKELALGYTSAEIVTQKDLMVQPNAPRFVRENDQLVFPVKIANLSEKPLSGTVSLEMLDAETEELLNAALQVEAAKPFSVPGNGSTNVTFSVAVPTSFTRPLTWRVKARAGDFSDGEQGTLPVLSNRMLVTESLPLTVRGSEQKSYRFEKLLQSTASKTLANHALTVEFTTNPAWYAVQALPYLMEFPYECAEQTWNRYYANAIATGIVNNAPTIAAMFDKWKTLDQDALTSNLLKNQDLKSVLLEETPWVLESKSETEQKKRIALLFDLAKMKDQLAANLQKLQAMQTGTGGFPWFNGGPDDRYITQYIVSGIGHLAKTGFFFAAQNRQIEPMLDQSLVYLDKQIKEDYNDLIRFKTDLKTYVPGPVQIQYLYLRSFFSDKPLGAESQKAHAYFRQRAIATWVGQSRYLQGMIALMANRSQDHVTAKAILKSLKETAIVHDELGMYWKNNAPGWWWHEAPIERQALLIEAFEEIGKDAETVGALKTWLLKNKQTNRWESTRATAEACYALLMRGSNWLAEQKNVEIRLGNAVVSSGTEPTEAGTGHFKKIFDAQAVTPEMGNVSVQVSNTDTKSAAPAWGAVYWQYFEDLDKITFAKTPLQLSKELYIERNSANGPMLMPVTEKGIHIGDKVVVRITLRADRDMEYVHMKDLRAAGMEPVNVLSGYRWQGGLGYYETTRDASTNFFFNRLPKGNYVFEYALFANQEGNFSNGITTIQCMYAPEFAAHSEGVRVNIVK